MLDTEEIEQWIAETMAALPSEPMPANSRAGLLSRAIAIVNALEGALAEAAARELRDEELIAKLRKELGQANNIERARDAADAAVYAATAKAGWPATSVVCLSCLGEGCSLCAGR